MRLKRICSEEHEFNAACDQLTLKLRNRGYEAEEIKTQIDKAALQDRNELLQYKNETKAPLQKIPCVLTYNRQLPRIKEYIDKHWEILKINSALKPLFAEKPFMAFKRNKNLRDMIGQKTLLNNKIIRKRDIRTQRGWCSPCKSHGNNLCCNHVRNTNEFKSHVTKEKFNIHHRVNCRSRFIVYLLDCMRCKMQYVGKSEWPLNIRINKHRNDTFREDAIMVCQHFNETTHTFKDHAKFTIIETIKNQD